MKRMAILLVVLLLALTACAKDEFTMPTGQDTCYTVTVLDPVGQPMPDITVEFAVGKQVVAQQSTDRAGVASVVLPVHTYTVTPVTQIYYYNVAAVTREQTDITVSLAYTPDPQTKTVFADGAEHALHFLTEGDTYVELIPGKRNYFLFAPDRAGTYRISAGTLQAGYYGTPEYVQQENLASADGQCSIRADMLGAELVLGVDAGEQEHCIVQILRIGEPENTLADAPWTEFVTTHTPAPFALELKVGQTLRYVDIFAEASAYMPVLAEDGLYHLNSADGPILYVNLGENAPYVSLRQLVEGNGKSGGTAFCRYFFDKDGELLKKEDYTEAISSYFPCLDPNYHIYPLTEDLAYMLQNGGAGWWDPTSEDYIFHGCTPEIGWLFSCCYVL